MIARLGPRVAGLFAGLVVGFLAAEARAQLPPGEEDDDDPALARRSSQVPAPVPVAAAAPPEPSVPPSSVAPVFPEDEPPRPRAPRPAPPAGVSSDEMIARRSTPPAGADAAAGQANPRLKLSYRRFSFVRIGAVDPRSPVGAAEQAFDSVALDAYPVSSTVRLGLSTQGGWHTGTLDAGGDYFVAQSISLGFQIAAGPVKPFVEGLVGGGYMRRMQLGVAVPTVYWQMGVDAGVELYVLGRSYLSMAVGYLRPVNGFASMPPDGKGSGFTSVYVNTWSFKLGVGI